MGVDRNTVSAWENRGVVPRDPATVAKLARVLGTTVEDLVGTPDATTPDTGQRATPHITAGTGLPHEVRVWLQAELLDYVRARVDGDDFADARRLLESPEFQRFYSGGEPRARTPEDMLKGMKFAAEAIRHELRRRGYKLGAEPTA